MGDQAGLLDDLFEEGKGAEAEDKGAESAEEDVVDEAEGRKQACNLSAVMLPLYSHPGSLQYQGCFCWAGPIKNFQIRVPLFVDVTLRVASILEKLHVLYL